MANVFPKLQIVKDFVTPFSKKRRFRTSFDSQHVKVSQTLVKISMMIFLSYFSSFCREMISKISPLSVCEILGVFVNTLTADDKYPVWDCENLPPPASNAMTLKTNFFFFVNFLVHLFNLHQILNIFKKI